jgi:hypothetical protein
MAALARGNSLMLRLTNRLLIAAVIVLAISAYGQTSCRAGGSYFDSLGQAFSGLQDIARALQ